MYLVFIYYAYVYIVLFFILNNSIQKNWLRAISHSANFVVPSICLIACTRGARDQLVFGFVLSLFPVATMFSVWFSVVVSLLFSSHHLASDTCFLQVSDVCLLPVCLWLKPIYECCALGVCHVIVIVFSVLFTALTPSCMAGMLSLFSCLMEGWQLSWRTVRRCSIWPFGVFCLFVRSLHPTHHWFVRCVYMCVCLPGASVYVHSCSWRLIVHVLACCWWTGK